VKSKKTLLVITGLAFFAGTVSAQQSSGDAKKDKDESQTKCPMHASHSSMNDRGAKGMGFSQSATTHHFFLTSSGGVIQVEVKDSADSENRNLIRMHLQHIAKAFQQGDFDIPMFVHDSTPPGVPEMKELRGEIRYSYEETPEGGRVMIVTRNQAALTAIYRFLRFQIAEHQTGDPTDIR
jgi:hypothetical protein